MSRLQLCFIHSTLVGFSYGPEALAVRSYTAIQAETEQFFPVVPELPRLTPLDSDWLGVGHVLTADQSLCLWLVPVSEAGSSSFPEAT